MAWKNAQKWEADWWNSCANTYGEEEKQILYARRMGLEFYHNKKSPYNIDMDGKRVIDIGGGPVSLLLKCTGLIEAVVVDPLKMPYWVQLRYEEHGIRLTDEPGEQMKIDGTYDEAWIYNCLQHTANPKNIVENALASAKIVRVFEWINTVINEGHPHAFTSQQLDKWFKGEGRVEELTGQANCVGTCYYGIFIGTRLDAGDS